MQSGQDLGADVVVKSSHADDVSGSLAFLDSVKPQVVVVDSERPTEDQSMAWAAARGQMVMDQAELGAIILSISETELGLRGYREAQERFLKQAR